MATRDYSGCDDTGEGSYRERMRMWKVLPGGLGNAGLDGTTTDEISTFLTRAWQGVLDALDKKGPTSTNRDVELLRRMTKIDLEFSTKYMDPTASIGRVTLTASSPGNTHRKTTLTVITFDLLVRALYYVYRGLFNSANTDCAVVSPSRDCFECGIILLKTQQPISANIQVAENNHLPAFQRLIIDVDACDATKLRAKSASTRAEVFQKRAELIQLMREYISRAFNNSIDPSAILLTARNDPDAVSFHLYVDAHVDGVTERAFTTAFRDTFSEHPLCRGIYKIDTPTGVSLPFARNHRLITASKIVTHDPIGIVEGGGVDDEKYPVTLQTFLRLSPLNLSDFVDTWYSYSPAGGEIRTDVCANGSRDVVTAYTIFGSYNIADLYPRDGDGSGEEDDDDDYDSPQREAIESIFADRFIQRPSFFFQYSRARSQQYYLQCHYADRSMWSIDCNMIHNYVEFSRAMKSKKRGLATPPLIVSATSRVSSQCGSSASSMVSTTTSSSRSMKRHKKSRDSSPATSIASSTVTSVSSRRSDAGTSSTETTTATVADDDDAAATGSSAEKPLFLLLDECASVRAIRGFTASDIAEIATARAEGDEDFTGDPVQGGGSIGSLSGGGNTYLRMVDEYAPTKERNRALEFLSHMPSTNDFDEVDTPHFSDIIHFPFTDIRLEMLSNIEAATAENREKLVRMNEALLGALYTTLAGERDDNLYPLILFILLDASGLCPEITTPLMPDVVRFILWLTRDSPLANRKNAASIPTGAVGSGGGNSGMGKGKSRRGARGSIRAGKIHDVTALLSGDAENTWPEDDTMSPLNPLKTNSLSWLKMILQLTINSGCVSSILSLLHRMKICRTIKSLLQCMFSTFELGTHAKYILSHWVHVTDPLPDAYLSTGFFQDDLGFMMLHIAHDAQPSPHFESPVAAASESFSPPPMRLPEDLLNMPEFSDLEDNDDDDDDGDWDDRPAALRSSRKERTAATTGPPSNRQRKTFPSEEYEFGKLVEVFRGFMGRAQIPVTMAVMAVFIRHIILVRDMSNKKYLIFSKRTPRIVVDTDITVHTGDLPTDIASFQCEDSMYSYCTHHSGIGLYSPMFNVFEFSAPSTRTLVSFQPLAQLNSRVMAQTYYPDFQTRLAHLYVKAKSFIQLCNENTLGALVLSPIAPIYALRSYLERNETQSAPLDEAKRYREIEDWEETKFAVILHDFATAIRDNSTIKRNIWNPNLFANLFRGSDDGSSDTTETEEESIYSGRLGGGGGGGGTRRYPNLSRLMKCLLILVSNLQEFCNFNMENFVGCINQIFGKDRAAQIGLDAFSADMIFSNTSTDTGGGGGGAGAQHETRASGGDNDYTATSSNRVPGGETTPADLRENEETTARIDEEIAAANTMPRYTANAYVLDPGLPQAQTQFIRSMIGFVQRKKAQIRARHNAILENVTVDAVATRAAPTSNNSTLVVAGAVAAGLTALNEIDADGTESRALSYTRRLPISISDKDTALGPVILLSVLLKLETSETLWGAKWFREIDPITQQTPTTLRFLFLLASWFIRIGPRHSYTKTKLFVWINKRRPQLYSELRALITETSGALLRCYGFSQFTRLFKRYDEITRVHVGQLSENMGDLLPKYLHNDRLSRDTTNDEAENFAQLSEREIEILVPAQSRGRVPRLIEAQSVNDKKMTENYYDNVVQAIAFQILYSEFSFDKFNDFMSFLLSLFIKGNIQRKFGLFYGISKSFKTRVLEMIGNMLRSPVVKTVSSTAIAGPTKNDFDPMALPMAFNTMVNIDEVSRVNVAHLKSKVGSAPITTRDMHGSNFLDLPTSATIVITTNVGFSLDFAAMSRVKLFRRNCPFCRVDDETAQNRWLPKVKCSDATTSLVGGMILNKCLVECLNGDEDLGIYTVCRYIWPLFFNNYITPIFDYESDTMRRDFQHYLHSNYSVANFFDSFEILHVPNGMSASDLFQFTLEWWRQNAVKFGAQSSENDHKTFFAEICQKLANLRHNQYYNIQLKPVR